MSTGRVRSDVREQFLRDVLITAVEGGIQYWAWVEDYDPDAGTVTVRAKDEYPDDDCPDEAIYRVTIDTIAKGIGVAKRTGMPCISGQSYVKQFWLADRTNGDDGDFDADIADNILQMGIFGEVVYG